MSSLFKQIDKIKMLRREGVFQGIKLIVNGM